jgi:hypothetical protein
MTTNEFMIKQRLPYDVKVVHAELRAREFYEETRRRGLNVHVSVGGLDSITLLVFLRSIGIDIPAVSVSVLENKSIQAVHERLGIIPLKPLKTKTDVIKEFGFPVISKCFSVIIWIYAFPVRSAKSVYRTVIRTW